MSAFPAAIERSPEMEGAILTKLREGTPLRTVAAQLFVSSAWVYKWARSDAEFAARVKAARPAKLVYEQAKRRLTAEQKARKRKGWCPDKTCLACASCKRVAAGRASHAPGVTRRPMTNCWTPAEEASIARLAERCTAREIAAAIAALGGVPRTAGAVQRRAELLGISIRPNGHKRGRLSMTQVAAVLHCDLRVVRRFVADGVLVGARQAAMKGSLVYIDRREVERFLHDAPWLYDPARLAPGRLGDVGRLAHRVDPWLPLATVARYLGYDNARGLARAVRDGTIPVRKRVLGHCGEPVRVVQRSQLPRIAAALEARRDAYVRRREVRCAAWNADKQQQRRAS